MNRFTSLAGHAAWLLSLTLLSASPLQADGSAEEASRLHDVRVEVRPEQRGHGRYRISATLTPAASPALKGDTGAIAVTAALVAKGTPMCPLPGSIFYDGFESP